MWLWDFLKTLAEYLGHLNKVYNPKFSTWIDVLIVDLKWGVVECASAQLISQQAIDSSLDTYVYHHAFNLKLFK